MDNDVKNLIRNKSICFTQRKPYVLPQAPFGTDFLNISKCSDKYQYTLEISDHFTKYKQIYATKIKTAKTTASKFCNGFILRFGSPERILQPKTTLGVHRVQCPASSCAGYYYHYKFWSVGVIQTHL